jgi:hypothetical protein
VVHLSHPLEAPLQAADSSGKKYARTMNANEGNTA